MATPTKDHVSLSAESIFARKLAGNEKWVRDKAAKKLQKWIVSKCASKIGLKSEQFIAIWKGLHYCMWMSDKPIIQEELAVTIATLIHCFDTKPEQGMEYFGVHLQTMAREWGLLDKWRVNKYMNMVRQCLKQLFIFLKKHNWNATLVDKFVADFYDKVLSHCVSNPFAEALKFHYVDIYIDELNFVGQGEVPSDVLHKFMLPFCKLLMKPQSETLMKHTRDNIFFCILQETLNMPADKGAAETKSQDDKDENTDENDEKDEKDVDDDEDFDPQDFRLKFDFAALAKHLSTKLARKEGKFSSRRLIQDIITNYENYTAGTLDVEVPDYEKKPVQAILYESDVAASIENLIELEAKIKRRQKLRNKTMEDMRIQYKPATTKEENKFWPQIMEQVLVSTDELGKQKLEKNKAKKMKQVDKSKGNKFKRGDNKRHVQKEKIGASDNNDDIGVKQNDQVSLSENDSGVGSNLETESIDKGEKVKRKVDGRGGEDYPSKKFKRDGGGGEVHPSQKSKVGDDENYPSQKSEGENYPSQKSSDGENYPSKEYKGDCDGANYPSTKFKGDCNTEDYPGKKFKGDGQKGSFVKSNKVLKDKNGTVRRMKSLRGVRGRSDRGSRSLNDIENSAVHTSAGVFSVADVGEISANSNGCRLSGSKVVNKQTKKFKNVNKSELDTTKNRRSVGDGKCNVSHLIVQEKSVAKRSDMNRNNNQSFDMSISPISDVGNSSIVMRKKIKHGAIKDTSPKLGANHEAKSSNISSKKFTSTPIINGRPQSENRKRNLENSKISTNHIPVKSPPVMVKRALNKMSTPKVKGSLEKVRESMSTPLSQKKRVSFGMQHNTSLDFVDSIHFSPGLPYNPKITPEQGILKERPATRSARKPYRTTPFSRKPLRRSMAADFF